MRTNVMNLRDLQYLVTLSELKHFGKTADACFVSQPTLSAQIKKLEAFLGVQLIERNKKKVQITPIGQAIANRARIILAETKSIRELAHSVHDPYSGEIKLGIIPTLAPYLLPHIMPAIRTQLTRLHLLLYEIQTSVLLNELQNGQIDAALLAIPVPDSGLVVEPLFVEPFELALYPKHAFASKKTIKLNELS